MGIARWQFIDPDGGVFELNDRQHTWVTRGVSGHIMTPGEINAYEVPFEFGEFVTSVSLKPRELVLPLLVAYESRADYLEAIRALTYAFNPTRGMGVIRNITSDGKVRDLNCRYKFGFGGNTDARGATPGSGLFNITFRASDPLWYDGDAFTDEFSIYENISPQPFFPFFPLRLSGSGIFNEVIINNPGDFPAYPIWRVYGVGSTPTITQTDTGQLLKVTVSLADNTEYIEIDTRPFHKSIFRDDGTNEFAELTEESELFPLAIGDNPLLIEMDGADANSLVTVSFNASYMAA